MRKLKPRSKIWLVDYENKVMMGGGRQCILEVIDRTGSMNKTAAELGMSFRTVWGKVRDTEERLGFKLVENCGLSRRSGSQLTADGRELLMKFQQFRQEAISAVDEIFKQFFVEEDA